MNTSLGGLQDSSLLELFAQEAQAQTQSLNAGLLLLEHSPRQAEPLEACMRAAHSLKGAARVVGLDLGVRVAHAMEDLLVAAQQGQLSLHAAHVDALLRGSDLLAQLGQRELPEPAPAQVDALLLALRPDAAATRSAPAPEPATPPPPAPAPAPASAASPATSEAGERVLRVSARHVDRLLDLSGKAVLAASRSRGFAAELHRLKRLQTQQRRLLEQLLHAPGTAPAAQWLAETRHHQEELQQGLHQCIEFFDEAVAAAGLRNQQLYDAALASRMRPLADLLGGRARMVRDLARSLGKQARLVVQGAHTSVDRDVLEQLDAPLTHLLRNAVDHGIESPAERRAAGKPEEGLLTLSAQHRRGLLVLELSDDGQGIDLARLRAAVLTRGLASEATAQRLSEEELLAFLFLPGFSLREQLSETSGRGVGLDAVAHCLRGLQGSVRLSQRAGQGCCFQLELPLARSVVRSLVVDVGGEAYAFPLAQIEHMLHLSAAEVVQLEGRQQFWHHGAQAALVSARQLLDRPEDPSEKHDTLCVVVLRDTAGRACGVTVDRFVGERMLVVMPLDPRLGKVRDIAAAGLLDDGAPVLILDLDDLLQSASALLGSGQLARVHRPEAGAGEAAARSAKRVLVVDDSLTVRELERKLLLARGYEVTVAVDGMDGWHMLRSAPFDLLITDVDMPRMDGIELVAHVRGDARLADLPVLIVSYKDRAEDRQRGLDAGADHYLAKASFHDDALLDAVQLLIGPPVD